MAFELKDLLTPAASLLAVWLTARFTLNREIRKKELEIRVDRLEKLSADCDEVLSQLIIMLVLLVDLFSPGFYYSLRLSQRPVSLFKNFLKTKTY